MAAAASGILFAAVLLLCISSKGVNGVVDACGLSSIVVDQWNTGEPPRNPGGLLDTTFRVKVTNTCKCPVKNVSLSSPGFTSSTPVDPKLFRRGSGGGGYVVNDGKIIPASASMEFRYSWDHAYAISPLSFTLACSPAS